MSRQYTLRAATHWAMLPLNEHVYGCFPIRGHRQTLVNVVTCRNVDLSHASIMEAAKDLHQFF